MGKGKGKWENSAEAGYIICFIVSLIVYALEPESTPILKNETIVVVNSINESYTLESSSSHIIIILHDGSNRKGVQECGSGHVEDTENWTPQLNDGVRHPGTFSRRFHFLLFSSFCALYLLY